MTEESEYINESMTIKENERKQVKQKPKGNGEMKERRLGRRRK